MSAPADSDLRELERELFVATEAGETRSFNDLRDRSGLDRDVLVEALGTLREHGKAVEAAPGQWRGPMADEVPAEKADPIFVETPDPPEEGLTVLRGTADFERLYQPQITGISEPTVRLTFAIADALEADALGQLVKAGIAEARADRVVFTLEVV